MKQMLVLLFLVMSSRTVAQQSDMSGAISETAPTPTPFSPATIAILMPFGLGMIIMPSRQRFSFRRAWSFCTRAT